MIDKKFRETSKEILVEIFNFLHSRVWVGDDEVREMSESGLFYDMFAWQKIEFCYRYIGLCQLDSVFKLNMIGYF